MGGRVAFLAPHASPYGNGWATTVLCCCSRRRPALAADRPWHRCKHRDSIPSELKVCSAAAVHKGHRRRRNGKSEHTWGLVRGGCDRGARGGIGGAWIRGRAVPRLRTSSARPRAWWHGLTCRRLELDKMGAVGFGTERVGRAPVGRPGSSAGMATSAPEGHAGPLPRAPRARKVPHTAQSCAETGRCMSCGTRHVAPIDGTLH